MGILLHRNNLSTKCLDRFYENHAGQALCVDVLQLPGVVVLLPFFALDGWRDEWTMGGMD